MIWKVAPKVTRFLRRTERVLLISGLALISAYLGILVYGTVASRTAIAGFRQVSSAEAATTTPGMLPAHENTEALGGINTSLWSEKRIHAYYASLAHVFGTPMAILAIPKINLEVPVFEGTDDLTLDRGAGRITGTSHPGQSGNIGIAGHRDGFFRGLKDVTKGDEIKLIMPNNAVATYVVDQITIVTPQDISVLQPRSVSSVTLVTCYPFYFIGSAPERYIVSASLREDAQPAASGNARPDP